MSQGEFIMLLSGMFVVTYLFRFVPLYVFNRIQIPHVVKIWLSYVPLSVFAALVTQTYLEPLGSFDIIQKLPLLLSGLVTGLLTWKSQSLGVGMGLGFLSFVLLQVCL